MTLYDIVQPVLGCDDRARAAAQASSMKLSEIAAMVSPFASFTNDLLLTLLLACAQVL